MTQNQHTERRDNHAIICEVRALHLHNNSFQMIIAHKHVCSHFKFQTIELAVLDSIHQSIFLPAKWKSLRHFIIISHRLQVLICLPARKTAKCAISIARKRRVQHMKPPTVRLRPLYLSVFYKDFSWNCLRVCQNFHIDRLSWLSTSVKHMFGLSVSDRCEVNISFWWISYSWHLNWPVRSSPKRIWRPWSIPDVNFVGIVWHNFIGSSYHFTVFELLTPGNLADVCSLKQIFNFGQISRVSIAHSTSRPNALMSS